VPKRGPAESEGGTRSRPFFNRADHGPEVPTGKNFKEIYLWATHSAIGGAPWWGDTPKKHTQANDKVQAVVTDEFIRDWAIKKVVPVAPPPMDYGY
jgi:hypothetical protein